MVAPRLLSSTESRPRATQATPTRQAIHPTPATTRPPPITHFAIATTTQERHPARNLRALHISLRRSYQRRSSRNTTHATQHRFFQRRSSYETNKPSSCLAPCALLGIYS